MSIRHSLEGLRRDRSYRRSLLAEAARFLLAGAGATALDFLLFWLLVSLFPDRDTACFAIAFFTSVTCRFFADKRFTFRDPSRRVGQQMFLYFASTLCTLLISLGVYSLCVRLGCAPLPAKLISMPFVTAAGYLLFKGMVFSSRAQARSRRP